MTYKVELIHSEEGYAAGCPELPGCWSEGQTEEEALANIKSAISEYLSVVTEMNSTEEIEKKVLFVDVPEPLSTKVAPLRIQAKPFKVVPIAMSIPHFTNAEDLLDALEGPDRR